MFDIFDNSEETLGLDTANRDFPWLLFLSFFALFVILLILIRPDVPAKDDRLSLPPGRVCAEIRWSDTENIDIDLWTQAPLDEHPVGYNHAADKVSSLMRDDRGKEEEGLSPLNYEINCTQSLPSGEYTFNVQYYKDHQLRNPVPPVVVDVTITVHPPEGAPTKMTETITLVEEGEEITVRRFATDASGKVIDGSVTKLYRKLSNAIKYTPGAINGYDGP